MTKYTFSKDFQLKILILCVQDPTFLPRYFDVLDASYFELASHAVVCDAILRFHKAYNTIPTKDALIEMVRDAPETLRDDAVSIVMQLFSLHCPDAEYVTDKIVEFGKRQSLLLAVQSILNILDTGGDYDRARSIMDKALMVGADRNGGTEFTQVMERIPQIAQESVYSASTKIPTLIPEVDRCLYGGLGLGEIGVILAPTAYGKSTVLTNLGAASVLAGYPVLHVTMELKEFDVNLRYAARFTGIPMDAIVRGSLEYLPVLRNQLISQNHLRVKYFTPHTLTPDGLRAFINYLRNKYDFHPRCLIIDYPDRMKMGEDRYTELGYIYDRIIGICHDFNCAGWLASQCKRDAWRSDITDLEVVGDSWKKCEDADVVIGLCQTKEERLRKQLRLYLGKTRRGLDGFSVRCHVNYATCTVKQHGNGVLTS